MNAERKVLKKDKEITLPMLENKNYITNPHNTTENDNSKPILIMDSEEETGGSVELK